MLNMTKTNSIKILQFKDELVPHNRLIVPFFRICVG